MIDYAAVTHVGYPRDLVRQDFGTINLQVYGLPVLRQLEMTFNFQSGEHVGGVLDQLERTLAARDRQLINAFLVSDQNKKPFG